MAITEASTRRAADPPVVLGASARAAKRRLALDYAHAVIEAPASTPADRMIVDLRHALFVVIHELEQVEEIERHRVGLDRARRALDAARRDAHRAELCAGSGLFVRAEDTDGDGVGTCPACRRYRPTRTIDARWRVVADHRTRP